MSLMSQDAKTTEQYTSLFKKYETMLKVGINAHNVVHKMRQDGCDTAAITVFESKHCIISAPILPTNKTKKKIQIYKKTEGEEISASSKNASPYIWSLIIAHWKRQSKIDKNIKDIDNIIINFICRFIYRLITIPDAVQRYAFWTGQTKQGPSSKPKKFKSGVYCTKKDFTEKFVNNKTLLDDIDEGKKYKMLVECLQNVNPKIDFDTEFVLILHLGIPQAACVHYNESFKTAKIEEQCLKLNVKYSQWRKWARYNSYVWCIVINKQYKFEQVDVWTVNRSHREFPERFRIEYD
eukprot:243585_1